MNILKKSLALSENFSLNFKLGYLNAVNFVLIYTNSMLNSYSSCLWSSSWVSVYYASEVKTLLQFKMFCLSNFIQHFLKLKFKI